MKLIELFIGCLTLAIFCLLAGKILLKSDKIKLIIKILSIIIVAVITTLLNIYITDSIKILVLYITFCLYYKIVFKKHFSEAISTGFLVYISLFMAEIIVDLFIMFIITTFKIGTMDIMKNNILGNFLICAAGLGFIYIFRNKLRQLVKNSDFTEKNSILMTFIIIFIIALLWIRTPLREWKLDITLFITMLILLGFCIIGIYLLKQRGITKKTTKMYQELVKYSDITNSVLEDYRMVSHEHKNQLSIIRGMVDNKNKELLDYLDKLMEKRNNIKYQWVGMLNYLPLSGLRGLINYKLIEMENLKLNKSIYISPEVSKVKLNKLSTNQKDELYSIIGVYLDNAIYAANQTKEKELSLEVFKEKNELVFILANSYSNYIDLKKIDDYGYTTKGKNHGVGLHIVKKIIDKENIFYQKRNVFKDYYIQELRIKCKK